jgi:hypothetical protein
MAGLTLGAGFVLALVLVLAFQSILGVGITHTDTVTASATATATTTATATSTSTATATDIVATTITATITTTSTTTTTETAPSPYEGAAAVLNAFGAHLANIATENVTAVMSGYLGDATVDWYGYTVGFGGNTPGAPGISILWTAMDTCLWSNVTIYSSNESLAFSGNLAIVNATLHINANTEWPGNSVRTGTLIETVEATTSFLSVKSGWLISNENWNFTSTAASQDYFGTCT